MEFIYPSKKELNELMANMPYLKDLHFKRQFKSQDKDFFEEMVKQTDTVAWAYRFENKLSKLRFSFLLTMFYFNKGIPDQQWIETTHEGLTKYFPNFKDPDDYDRKFIFDYFAEVYYYHFFSSLDILDQILNSYFNFQIPDNDNMLSKKVLEKLKNTNESLHLKLNAFKSKVKKSRWNRNKLTHSFSILDIDTRSKKEYIDGKKIRSFGGANYITSNEIITEMRADIEVFGKLIKEIELALE